MSKSKSQVLVLFKSPNAWQSLVNQNTPSAFPCCNLWHPSMPSCSQTQEAALTFPSATLSSPPGLHQQSLTAIGQGEWEKQPFSWERRVMKRTSIWATPVTHLPSQPSWESPFLDTSHMGLLDTHLITPLPNSYWIKKLLILSCKMVLPAPLISWFFLLLEFLGSNGTGF